MYDFDFHLDAVRGLTFYSDAEMQNELNNTESHYESFTAGDAIYVVVDGNYYNESIGWLCNNDTVSAYYETGLQPKLYCFIWPVYLVSDISLIIQIE